jgi:hypothetical protein
MSALYTALAAELVPKDVAELEFCQRALAAHFGESAPLSAPARPLLAGPVAELAMALAVFCERLDIGRWAAPARASFLQDALQKPALARCILFVARLAAPRARFNARCEVERLRTLLADAERNLEATRAT